MTSSNARNILAAVIVLAVAAALGTKLLLDRHKAKTVASSSATPTSSVVAARPHFYVPTIKISHTTGPRGAIYLNAIKADGAVSESRVTGGTDVLTFTKEEAVPQAKGARGFGISVIARADGGVVTRQPFTGEWTSSPGLLNMSRDLPVGADERLLQLMFPTDTMLFSGGTFLQGIAPLGEPVKNSRLKRFWVARNVVQWGVSRQFLAALFSDGTLVSVGRGAQGKMTCIGHGAVSLSVSPIHAAAAFADGTVRMWGDLSMNQLGKKGQASSVLTQVPHLKNITQVAISEALTLTAIALDRDGNVWEWGGTGHNEFMAPRLVKGLSEVAFIQYDIGGFALRKDGSAWVFQPTTDRAPQRVFEGAVKPVEELRIPPPTVSSCVECGANGSRRLQAQLLIDTLLSAARATNAKWHVPISVVIAQSALETGWGSVVVDGAYFGVKKHGYHGETSSITTHENIADKSIKLSLTSVLTRHLRKPRLITASS